ncbi:hypothetical protein [Oceaniglobus ichthyenteri]|uniref:hypothetical protein n=1 Tax=Oceaniglobus ichthyenteri TaxID=2136177 RepID=UPI000D3AA2CE|nr:hypothetical protein [Oceaniglobus ichthyenteri]
MKHFIFAAFALLATPLAAETPLTGPEFDAYTQGKTLYFNSGGVSYGVEEYMPNRRVRWSFLDGECKEGEWYENGSQICFEYDDGTGPQCWTFFKGQGGLRARFEGENVSDFLYEARQSDEPMVCLGPKIGV